LDVIAQNLNESFDDLVNGSVGSGTPSAWAQEHLATSSACNPVSWKDGDLVTNTQYTWPITLLQLGFGSVYASTFDVVEVGIPGTAGFSIQVDSVSGVWDYLPAVGSPAALNADLFDPLTSPSGQFGGDVLALRLNIDFADAGYLPASSGLKFGDLTVCGLTSDTDLNGQTVRQVLGITNAALGGGSHADSISDLDTVAVDLNNSFSVGTPSAFAQAHLIIGACP